MSIPFLLICGSSNYDSPLKGYEDVRVTCPRCHNASVVALKQRRFISFWWIPVIPTSWADVLQCTICPWSQETTKEQLDGMKGGAGGPVR
ncbi:uncharacterized protein V1516DRAFT_116431 [Lipomyces oligophaga]|uniref:uncharacterized protein n=1 Tax=Lipomyces oligophaga TaxID=45792 RepID=UPI0034CDFE78